MRAIQSIQSATFEPVTMRFFDVVTRRGVRRAYRWLLDTQKLDRAAMVALQEDELTRLFVHAHEFSPFYRERLTAAGWRPGDRATLGLLRTLPALEKPDIQTQLDAVSTVGRWGGGRPIQSNTGGTTGAPTTFWVNSEGRDRRVAGTLRDQTWLGLRPGDPIAYLGGSSLGVPRSVSAVERLKWVARGQLFLSAWDLSDGALASYADQLERFRPKLLLGYAGALHAFARYLNATGRKVRIPAVQATAEMLYPEWREAIAQAFGGPVYERYGTREVGDIAASCATCGGMHLNEENVVVDVDEATGELHITDLTNYATPFVRYRIGDRGTLAEPDPACRPGLRRLDSLDGRAMDVLETADGGRVSAVILVHSLKDFPQIRAHQLWQPAGDRVQVVVAAAEEPPLDRIQDALKPHFGGTRLEVIWTHELPQTANGKLKFVVRDAEYDGPRSGV
jgi:phenylacetate-CoA ligase